MSFFKEFKDDLSQAVNELMPGEDELEYIEPDDSATETGTVNDDVDVESELLKLDGLLEKVSKEVEEKTIPKPEEIPVPEEDVIVEPEADTEKESALELDNTEAESLPDIAFPEEETEALPGPEEIKGIMEQETKEVLDVEVPDVETSETEVVEEEILPMEEILAEEEVLPEISVEPEEDMEEKENAKEDAIMSSKQEENLTNTEVEIENTVNGVNSAEVTDETAVITTGMKIEGNITSTGSLDIQGEIKGDVTCNGKLSVTGKVTGNSNSSEFFADSAKIEGEITSVGTVKIGLGSVVIGNVKATSAVIAGAIKGDIDVQGPVVVDTSAVVVGNIKSRSVQINNGAVIEGFCSQCYADIDMENLFGEKKGK